jgi:hypothetical protein
MIELSMNEVETLAAKTARGAGLAWGLADDVGRAARRMAEAGLDWATATRRLAEGAARAKRDDAAIGAELADVAAEGVLLRRFDICEPALVAALAAAADEPRRIAWADGVIEVRGGRIVRAQGAGLGCPGPVAIVVTPDPAMSSGGVAQRRAWCASAALAALEVFIARIYVPASDRSRVSGAGAALDDND